MKYLTYLFLIIFFLLNIITYTKCKLKLNQNEIPTIIFYGDSTIRGLFDDICREGKHNPREGYQFCIYRGAMFILAWNTIEGRGTKPVPPFIINNIKFKNEEDTLYYQQLPRSSGERSKMKDERRFTLALFLLCSHFKPSPFVIQQDTPSNIESGPSDNMRGLNRNLMTCTRDIFIKKANDIYNYISQYYSNDWKMIDCIRRADNILSDGACGNHKFNEIWTNTSFTLPIFNDLDDTIKRFKKEIFFDKKIHMYNNQNPKKPPFVGNFFNKMISFSSFNNILDYLENKYENWKRDNPSVYWNKHPNGYYVLTKDKNRKYQKTIQYMEKAMSIDNISNNNNNNEVKYEFNYKLSILMFFSFFTGVLFSKSFFNIIRLRKLKI